jgi:uncharacterized membrane protein
MKKIARILLLVFVVTLVTPTIVCAVEQDADTSSVFSMSEEEQALKDSKVIFYNSNIFNSIFLSKEQTQPILSNNVLKHDDVALGIFIPPPELV